MAGTWDPEVASAYLRALAHPLRMQIMGAIVGEARTLEELSMLLATDIAAVARQVRKLERAGMVVGVRDTMIRYRADLSGLQKIAMRTGTRARMSAGASVGDVDAETRRVLNAFFDGSRVVALPVKQRKKELVLEEILRRIPVQRVYRESELNRLIEPMFEDYCTVRREWIDRKYMVRDHGLYRLTDRGRAVHAQSPAS